MDLMSEEDKTKKIEIFKSFLKIIKQKNKESEIQIQEKDGINTWYMKMLYFTCLQSVDTNKTNDIGLFKYFNNWFAYTRGPVEKPCYDVLLECSDIESAIDEEDEVVEKIKEAIDYLYNTIIDVIKNVQGLVNLSHDLYLWEKFRFHTLNNDDCKMKLDAYLIKQERLKFNRKINSDYFKEIYGR